MPLRYTTAMAMQLVGQLRINYSGCEKLEYVKLEHRVQNDINSEQMNINWMLLIVPGIMLEDSASIKYLCCIEIARQFDDKHV